jgi:hypothetical protein
MQEKTLEEEFEEFIENETMLDFRVVQSFLPFIRSREEKAREEGRKESLKVIKNNIVEEVCKEAITQYKEELLWNLLSQKKLYCNAENNGFFHKHSMFDCSPEKYCDYCQHILDGKCQNNGESDGDVETYNNIIDKIIENIGLSEVKKLTN